MLFQQTAVRLLSKRALYVVEATPHNNSKRQKLLEMVQLQLHGMWLPPIHICPCGANQRLLDSVLVIVGRAQL